MAASVYPPVQLYDALGNAVTSLKVTAGGPASGQAQKNYTGTIVLSATVPTTVTLETVTTGKQYLITDISITGTGITGQLLCKLQMGGADVENGYINTTKGIELPGIESGSIATTGQLVALVFPLSPGPPTIAYNVKGVEY